MTDEEFQQVVLSNFQRVLKEIGGINNEISSMKSALDEHSSLLKALEHRVEENTAGLTFLGEDINYLKGEVAGLRTDVAELKTEVANVNCRLDWSTEVIWSVKRRQNELEAEVIELQEAAGPS